MTMRTITPFILAVLLLPASLSAQLRGTWKKSLVCTHCTPVDMAFADTNTGFVVATPNYDPGPVFMTRDAGVSFVTSDSELSPDPNGGRASCPAPDFWVYQDRNSLTYYSTDLGKDWMFQADTEYDASGNQFWPLYTVPISIPTPDRSIHLVTSYTSTDRRYSYWFSLSTDRDLHFHPLGDTIPTTSGTPSISAYASPDLSVLISVVQLEPPFSHFSKTSLARSTDSGAHWKFFHPLDISVPFTSFGYLTPGYGAGHFFLGGGRQDSVGGKVSWLDDYLESTDTGSTWHEVQSVSGGRVDLIANPGPKSLWVTVKNSPISYDFSEPYNKQLKIYADSLFYSSDGGASWTKDGTTFQGDTIIAMRWITPNNGYVMTFRDSNTYLYHYSEAVNSAVAAAPAPSTDALVLYPSIAQDRLTIESDRRVTVVDALGRTCSCPRTERSVDISRLPAGVYYVSDGGSTNGAPRRARFVKE